MRRKKHFRVSSELSKKNSDFMSMAYSLLSGMSEVCSESTVYNCETALRALQRYMVSCHPEMKGRLPLRCLRSELVLGFQRYHLRRGVSENAIRAYLRSLRSLVNRCIRMGQPLRGDIFSMVSTSTLPTAKRPLTERAMRRIYGAPVKAGSKDERVRDFAVFSYLAGGIPFADLARLKPDNYNPATRELTYRRHKTGVSVKVRLTKEAHRIWLRYADAPSNSPYHFNLISSADPVDAARECGNALAAYNRGLERLTARCGIVDKVTSYTFRHTFATVARNNYKAEMNVISIPLGHRSERTTAIYVGQIETDKVYGLQKKMEQGLLR